MTIAFFGRPTPWAETAPCFLITSLQRPSWSAVHLAADIVPVSLSPGFLPPGRPSSAKQTFTKLFAYLRLAVSTPPFQQAPRFPGHSASALETLSEGA